VVDGRWWKKWGRLELRVCVSDVCTQEANLVDATAEMLSVGTGVDLGGMNDRFSSER
jgi:hypothetical protein